MLDYAILDQTQGAWPDSAAVTAKFLEAEQELSPAFCDAWGLAGMQGRVIADASQAASCDVVFALQNSDPNVPGAMGYHDEQGGIPFARILTDTVLQNGGGALDGGSLGVSVLSVFLHELWEAAIDLYVDDLVLMPSGIFVFKEVSDPVQSVPLSVTFADGTTGLASDAVFPRYFDGQAPAGTQLSLASAPTVPFEITPGGYQSQFDPSKIADPSGPIVTVWGEKVHPVVRSAKIAGGRLKERVERMIRHLSASTGRDAVWQHRVLTV
jgi:hypothetical protein